MIPGPDSRLGQFLAEWVKEEVQSGFRVYLSRSFEVRFPSGKAYPFGEVLTAPQPTAEAAARTLAEALTCDTFVLGITPATHLLVWREDPEVQQFGVFCQEWKGYARLAFVPADGEPVECERA